jgi:5-methylcytosine-specific restriction endonuclease McrA
MAFDHQIDGTELLPKRTTKLRFRASIFDDWASCCAYCSKPADTLDHVVPRLKGGLTMRENLVPACRRCNGAKGSDDWQEWFKDQPYWMLSREDAVHRWLSSGGKIP